MLDEPIWQLADNLLDFIKLNQDMIINCKFGIESVVV